MTASAAPALSATKIPSLDGLRAVAVTLVLLGHLEDTRGFGSTGLFALVGDYANLGVRVFFVISGFLITRLLIQEYEQDGSISLPLFYARRALRIVPAFVVFVGTITLCAALGLLSLTRADLVHAVTYTTNFQENRSWYLGHLWSLSVEEQFYLLWPFILGAVGIRRSMRVAAGCLALGPLTRIALRLFAPGHYFDIFPAVADALAAGCLLAGLREQLWGLALYRRVVSSPHLMWAAPLALFSINRTRGYTAGWVVGEAVLNLTIAVLIDGCVSWPSRGPARLLNTKPLVAMGLLSYSLYLWQQPFLHHQSSSWVAAFPQNILLAATCAATSYYALEKPFMRMRTRLRPTRPVVAPARPLLHPAEMKPQSLPQ